MLATESIKEQIAKLEPIKEELLSVNSLHSKLKIIRKHVKKSFLLKKFPFLTKEVDGLNESERYLVESIVLIGQEDLIFQAADEIENWQQAFHQLLQGLQEVDRFYDTLGGLIGYHLMVLKLIYEKENPEKKEHPRIRYSKPPGIDISKETKIVRHAIRSGIESLPKLGEIYPIGGAGDRLNHKDEETGEFLPVAQLQFGGYTLLDCLVRDIQAREYLYFKLTGKQVITPIAVMTSHEKHNHARVYEMCERNHWFSRPKESFFFFIQPLVPVLSCEGQWMVTAPLQPIWKPGGHGIIWKLAKDSGVFDWLRAQKRGKVLVRQINNPAAGIDGGLLAFSGFGFMGNKAFGFASCPRLLNTAEGMNVLLERKVGRSYLYAISNVEYTDFVNKGIPDKPQRPGSRFSAFPANTNILFVDIEKIDRAIKKCPIPGLIINMKQAMTCKSSGGALQQLPGGRLESTMQNIADHIVDRFSQKIVAADAFKMSTYLTYNIRRKTIAVTKKAYVPGHSMLETPEGCFYEMLHNYYELLKNYCQCKVKKPNEKMYLAGKLPFNFSFHPSLGPLFSVIGQKVRKCHLAMGAEMQLELAELDVEKLSLSGSLLVQATSVMGYKNGRKKSFYSSEGGKCVLKNVNVNNKGIDYRAKNQFWKGQIQRQESLTIILEGNAEFHAEDVTFNGHHHIVVSNNQRLTVYEKDGAVYYHTEKIKEPTWYWEYCFDAKDRILLAKHKSRNSEVRL